MNFNLTFIMAQANVFLLAADNHPSLLPLLRSQPTLASSQDSHGYSLLHAAVSYGYVDLLKTLVFDFHVNINLKDEDGETALFVAETAGMAEVLIREIGIDSSIKNAEGLTAEEKIRAEGDFPAVAEFLHLSKQRSSERGSSHPPPLPPNVTVNLGTADPDELEGRQVANADLKKRIQELAARPDFHQEAGQRELRELVADAVREVEGERAVRRRT